MEKAFHHKKTGVTFPICLGKRSVHNFSHSVNMAATLNITLWYPDLKDLDNSVIQITQTNPTISLENNPHHYDVFLFPGDGRRGKWYVRVFQDPHPAGADSFQETHGQDHSSCGDHAHRYTFTDDWYSIVDDVMRNSAHRYTLTDDWYSIVDDVMRNSAQRYTLSDDLYSIVEQVIRNSAHRYTLSDDLYSSVDDVMRNSAQRYTLSDDLFSIVYDVIRNSAHKSKTKDP